MIESSTIPPEAVDYLNEINQPKPDDDIAMKGRIQSAKDELLAYCNSFIDKSKEWRTASYETKWLRYQRAADGIYEPTLSAAKESWQSKVHVGMTASHRESIHAYLFKVMCGTTPPFEIAPRFDLGEQDQSENIKDIILREMDKARWEVEFDATLHDADTYGSGFIRRFWKTETAVRKLKKPIKETFTDNLNPMGMIGFAKRAAMGDLKTVGYQEDEVEVITYRGLKVQHISIWDVFKTPNTIKIPGTTIGIRYWITYGDIIKGAKEGYYLPEAIEKLKGIASEKKFSQGEDTVNADRGITETTINNIQPDYAKELECFEVFGRIPKKWLYTIIGQEITDDPEELVSARIIFNKLCLVGVEVNDEYDGEPAIHQINYFTKNRDSYGLGVPEMLESPQAVVNEIVNQRLDSGSQALNHHFAVLEGALVNPKEDLKSKASCVIRLDMKKTPNATAANAITELPISDIPVRAGFAEVNEWERFAQERTSSNRIMQGSTGTGKDGTKTLGEQQMLMESAGAKFSYIGLVMELSFSQEFFHGIWKTVYKNIDAEDIEDSIGPERAKSFILITPEEIMRDYIYKPLGVFTAERKAEQLAKILQIRREFIGAPWIDDEKMYDSSCRAVELDGDSFKKTDEQIMQAQAMQIQPGMGMEQEMTGNAGIPPMEQPSSEQMGLPQA
jgi:hypothetical protein